MAGLPDSLREVMRGWPTGVAVVTSESSGVRHGLTVNSLASVSLDPPRVVFSVGTASRTLELIRKCNSFAITMLEENQEAIADVFAGKTVADEDRFEGLETFTLSTGCPLLKAGHAFLDCVVVHEYVMLNSTLFVGEVVAAQNRPGQPPLVYLNRGYHQVAK
jgi:flavin reductase (DIM6/NTAB) family NADH-FMN oxidoreductase RutF